jgi:pimeloyl-ACP methyl ester carboxylesterase
VASDLGQDFQVLRPELVPYEGLPGGLERLAERVVAVIEDRGLASACVCGVGIGAMVALQAAADHPDRVERLALVTRQVAVSPILLSLPAAVLGLLPATTLARLGAGQDQLLALLDQVRPVDFARLAPRVHAPSTVICAQRDPVNRRSSAALSRDLPNGQLEFLPAAGPDWLAEHPHLLTEALRRAFPPPS